MDQNFDNSSIVKKVVYAGTKPVTFRDGAKVFFHFQTRIAKDKTLLDDSRKMGQGKPLELVLGKKFKLEVWEVILQKMALNEVATFTVHKTLVIQYPFVSKTLREAHIPPEDRKTHCCAMTLQQEGVGYEDLNNILKSPADLEFTIELLRVEQPEEYKKDTWQMDDKEQLERVKELRENGNATFKEMKYQAASDCYSEALGILERLMLKEKPQSQEWLELNGLKMPLLLNFSQCKLNEKDYYAVIEHCSTVLNSEPDNVKALFRRAKAHVGAWNPMEAKDDFNKVIDLDTTLTAVVKKELENLDELVKWKDIQDKEKLKGLFSK